MRPEHQRLLDELWSDQTGSRRAALLTAGGAILRRKRRVRVVRRVAGVALAICAIILLSLYFTQRHPLTHARFAKSAIRRTDPGDSAKAKAIRVLNDDELLAMFPGTPVGIATVNGKKRLIFPRSQDEQKYVIQIDAAPE